MKRLNILFLMFLFMPNAFAGNVQQSGQIANWTEKASLKYCQSHNAGSGNPCIGDSRGNCAAKSFVSPDYSDEYGILMMVATSSNSGGARFCPVSIIAKNKNKDHSWTRYFSAGTDENCVWLCKKGFTGETCGQKDTDPIRTFDSTPLLQLNYDSIHKIADSGVDIEDTVAMIEANMYTACYGRKDNKTDTKAFSKAEEHDIVLAISDWLPSGHGARVRPYTIRAERSGWDDMISWIDIYPASNSDTVACKNGYKANASNTDCVPIDAAVTGETVWCDGWYESNFQSEKHIEKTVGSCVQWRCKESGYGLSKAGVSQCVSCGTSQMDGVNPIDGTCVHCPMGKTFSSTAPGYCADAFALNKNALMYGSEEIKQDVKEQCWMKADLTDYKNCVLKQFKMK